LTGVIDNYNTLRKDPKLEFTKHDLCIFLVCDGYQAIPESFKKLGTEKGFFNEDILRRKGFM